MGTELYDAIIVGARPAGASMAAFLSQAGFRVLLVDRATFPKPTLSCPIYFGNALDILNRIGVLEKIPAFDAPKLYLHQTHILDIHLRGRMLPYNGFDYAYQIRRERFDTMLFEHVAQLPNVETRLGFTVTQLVWENGRVVGVRGHGEEKSDEEIRAELVGGADGVFSTVAEQVNVRRYNIIPPRTCVYYAYYTNVTSPSNEPSAIVYYEPHQHFAFITANSESDLTVISLSMPASEFEHARVNHETIHAEFAKKMPEMAERMKNAKRETPMYGVSPRESFYRAPFGAGWALVGDAGYYKDPIVGQGIHDALRSSELAAQAYIEYRRADSSPQAWDTAFRNYQYTRDRETKWMYKLTDYYASLDKDRSAAELDLFRAMAEMPDWSNRYVSLFNGVTDPGWFMNFPTPMRIWTEWRWRQLKTKFSRSPLKPKFHAE